MSAVADELMAFDQVDDAAMRRVCSGLIARMPSCRRLT
jgi:hypothetical protein